MGRQGGGGPNLNKKNCVSFFFIFYGFTSCYEHIYLFINFFISKTTNFLSVLVQTCHSLYKPDKLKSCKGNQLGRFFDKSEFIWVQQAITSSQVSKYDYYCAVCKIA